MSRPRDQAQTVCRPPPPPAVCGPSERPVILYQSANNRQNGTTTLHDSWGSTGLLHSSNTTQLAAAEVNVITNKMAAHAAVTATGPPGRPGSEPSGR